MTLLLQLQACAAKSNALYVAQKHYPDRVRAPPTCTIVKTFEFNSELTDEQLSLSAQILLMYNRFDFNNANPSLRHTFILTSYPCGVYGCPHESIFKETRI